MDISIMRKPTGSRELLCADVSSAMHRNAVPNGCTIVQISAFHANLGCSEMAADLSAAFAADCLVHMHV